jgi:hypothetical protein
MVPETMNVDETHERVCVAQRGKGQEQNQKKSRSIVWANPNTQ